jgi:hypothetical protein
MAAARPPGHTRHVQEGFIESDALSIPGEGVFGRDGEQDLE